MTRWCGETLPELARCLVIRWGIILNVIHWVAIAITLALITKRLNLRRAVPIILVAAVTISFFGPLLFEPFAIELELDAP